MFVCPNACMYVCCVYSSERARLPLHMCVCMCVWEKERSSGIGRSQADVEKLFISQCFNLCNDNLSKRTVNSQNKTIEKHTTNVQKHSWIKTYSLRSVYILRRKRSHIHPLKVWKIDGIDFGTRNQITHIHHIQLLISHFDWHCTYLSIALIWSERRRIIRRRWEWEFSTYLYIRRIALAFPDTQTNTKHTIWQKHLANKTNNKNNNNNKS